MIGRHGPAWALAADVVLIVAVVVLIALLRARKQRRGLMIALQVLASWLIAVAVLVAALSFLNVTPGYQPDHLE
jgi:hypothetical protein